MDSRCLAEIGPELPPDGPQAVAVEADRLAQAVSHLERHDPSFSAKSGLWLWQRLGLAGAALTGLVTMISAPASVLMALQALLAAAFALQLPVRVLAIRHALRVRSNLELGFAPVPDQDLPVYTVLIALHAEVPVVPQLVAALRALDYPHDKLDIIFALEAHDDATRRALADQNLPAHMRLIIVPAGLPRTKPRALCYALTFARGDMIVVYDAEDQPEPGQLREAVCVFAGSGPTLGCLQARLAINNAHRSWLTAQFAIEYTALFDGVLPALAHYGLPVPLGGSSNHFRRVALDDTGGWDPYNVTEDADLGLRLARMGWRVGVLTSTTWEEAPPDRRAWFNQRTRWQKGWLQTYFVHMRDPRRLWRELGPKSWLWFQILLGGGLLSALAHPWFWLLLIWSWTQGRLLPAVGGGPEAWLNWLGIANLGTASAASILLARMALKRRKRADLMGHALISPLYWIPISCAAYRAVHEWRTSPFYWAKTPHVGTPAPGADQDVKRGCGLPSTRP